MPSGTEVGGAEVDKVRWRLGEQGNVDERPGQCGKIGEILREKSNSHVRIEEIMSPFYVSGEIATYFHLSERNVIT